MKKFLTILTVFIVMAVLSTAIITVFAGQVTRDGTGSITFRSDTQILPPPTVDPTSPTLPTWPTGPTAPPTPPPGWGDIGLEGHNLNFGSRMLGGSGTPGGDMFKTTDQVGDATLDSSVHVDGIPPRERFMDIVVYNMSVDDYGLTASRTPFTAGTSSMTDVHAEFSLDIDTFQEYIAGGTVTQTPTSNLAGNNIVIPATGGAIHVITDIPPRSWVGARWSGALRMIDWTDVVGSLYTTTITWTLVTPSP